MIVAKLAISYNFQNHNIEFTALIGRWFWFCHVIDPHIPVGSEHSSIPSAYSAVILALSKWALPLFYCRPNFHSYHRCFYWLGSFQDRMGSMSLRPEILFASLFICWLEQSSLTTLVLNLFLFCCVLLFCMLTDFGLMFLFLLITFWLHVLSSRIVPHFHDPPPVFHLLGSFHASFFWLKSVCAGALLLKLGISQHGCSCHEAWSRYLVNVAVIPWWDLRCAQCLMLWRAATIVYFARCRRWNHLKWSIHPFLVDLQKYSVNT